MVPIVHSWRPRKCEIETEKELKQREKLLKADGRMSTHK